MELDIKPYKNRENIYVLTIKINMNRAEFNKVPHRDTFRGYYEGCLDDTNVDLLVVTVGIPNFSIDSEGLGKFIKLKNYLKEKGGKIKFANVDGKLERLITQCKWPANYFMKYDSVEDAIKAYDNGE